MKFLAATFVFFMSVSALAQGTCSDFSGLYTKDDGGILRIKQDGCKSITYTPDTDNATSEVVPLDGSKQTEISTDENGGQTKTEMSSTISGNKITTVGKATPLSNGVTAASSEIQITEVLTAAGDIVFTLKVGNNPEVVNVRHKVR